MATTKVGFGQLVLEAAIGLYSTVNDCEKDRGRKEKSHEAFLDIADDDVWLLCLDRMRAAVVTARE